MGPWSGQEREKGSDPNENETKTKNTKRKGKKRKTKNKKRMGSGEAGEAAKTILFSVQETIFFAILSSSQSGSEISKRDDNDRCL